MKIVRCAFGLALVHASIQAQGLEELCSPRNSREANQRCVFSRAQDRTDPATLSIINHLVDRPEDLEPLLRDGYRITHAEVIVQKTSPGQCIYTFYAIQPRGDAAAKEKPVRRMRLSHVDSRETPGAVLCDPAEPWASEGVPAELTLVEYDKAVPANAAAEGAALLQALFEHARDVDTALESKPILSVSTRGFWQNTDAPEGSVSCGGLGGTVFMLATDAESSQRAVLRSVHGTGFSSAVRASAYDGVFTVDSLAQKLVPTKTSIPPLKCGTTDEMMAQGHAPATDAAKPATPKAASGCAAGSPGIILLLAIAGLISRRQPRPTPRRQ